MANLDPLAFEHVHVPATEPGRAPLLLLHGTGGDENDLLGLGRSVAPGAALLSPRGPVLERGMPRFFSRFAEGVFDLDEVRRRSHDLADFVAVAREHYGLSMPMALGYSNGANIAAAMIIVRPETLAGAILLRPMAILDEDAGNLGHASILMLSGASDSIVSLDSARALAERLRAGGADVEHRILAASHGITQDDVTLAKSWLETIATR